MACRNACTQAGNACCQMLTHQQPVADAHAVLMIGWSQSESKLVPAKQAGEARAGAVTIVRRFHFSSSLKRMSCIVKVLPFNALVQGPVTVHAAASAI